MIDHEAAVAAFLAQASAADPARFARVAALYPVDDVPRAATVARSYDPAVLDVLAVRYRASESHAGSVPGPYVSTEAVTGPPPAIAAMNQRRQIRRPRRRPPGPQRGLAVPFFPLDRPIVLERPERR